MHSDIAKAIAPVIPLTLVRELQAKKLVNVRFHPKHQNVAILKYSKRAFWTRAWDEYPILKNLRGMIVDWNTGRVIAHPFTKVFNYGEVPETYNMFLEDEEVHFVQKINGFLAIATYDEEIDDFIIASSGTFDSDFAEMANEYLNNVHVKNVLKFYSKMTFMFEITHPNDPHIVEEKFGAWLIGARSKLIGCVNDEVVLDSIYEAHFKSIDNIYRPKHFMGLFCDRRLLVDRVNIEGYMIRSIEGDKIVKIKTKDYLFKKFISRSNKVDAIWTDPDNFLKTVDEDFHEIAKKIPKFVELSEWKAISNTERLEILKSFM